MYSGGIGAALFPVGSLGSSVPGGVWSSIHLQASSLLLWAVIDASGRSHTAVTIETRQGAKCPCLWVSVSCLSRVARCNHGNQPVLRWELQDWSGCVMRVSCSEHRHHATFCFVWLKGSRCCPGSGKESMCLVAERTSFWSWTALGFNSGSATSFVTLGKLLNSPKPQSSDIANNNASLMRLEWKVTMFMDLIGLSWLQITEA